MSRMRTNTVPCPRCGRMLELVPHPIKASRIIAVCECNIGPLGDPLGPVIETNASDAPSPRVEEVNNGSTIG